MWLLPPGWRAPGEVEEPESSARPAKDVPGWLGAYGVLQFLLLAVVGSALQWLGGGLGLLGSAVIVVLVLWGTGTIGALFEGNQWAVRLELLRLGLSAAVALLATLRFEAAWLVPTAVSFILSGVALMGLVGRAAPRIANPSRSSFR
jgi:hypothetical protein